jgi:type I restriction enzyme S subunit
MSLPRYGKYKESGIVWLGKIPTEWNAKRIKHTTYLKGRVGWKGLTSDEYLESGYAYLVTGTDFSKKFINWHECHYVEKARYEDDPFIQLRDEDLLITKDGTIGKLALVSKLDRPACLNSGIFLIRPTSDYVTEYMYWVLQSEAFKVFCDLSSLGSTIQHLYQNVFEDFAFPIPSLPEQRSIAAFLDRETAKIDALIAEQEKLIALLAEKRQATISHAVTRGFNPNAPMKDSGVAWLGEVPAHWEVKPLRYCLDYQEGPGILAEDFRDEGVPLLRVAGVQSQLATLEGCNFLDPEKVQKRWQHFRLNKGDLLISASASMGTICEVSDEAEGAIPYTGIIRLRGHAGEMVKNFVRHMVVSRPFLTQIDLLKAGATIQHYGPTHLSQMFVIRPPVTEQLKIAAFIDQKLERLDKLSAEAGRAITLLTERRNALISAAVTGQIDVRGLVEPQPS